MPASGPTVESPVNYLLNETAAPLTATLSGTGSELKWYSVAEGANYSSTAYTPSTTAVGTSSYWVSQADANGCESKRSTIKVIVNNPLSVNCPGAYSIEVCENQTTVNDEFILFLNSFSYQNGGENDSISYSMISANGFTGVMAPANWTTPEQSPSASASHSESALTMSAGQGGGGTTKRITITSDGEISFDYTAQFTGSGGLAFSYKINGVSTEISNGTGSGSKMGIVVKAGDVFEFYTWGFTQYSTYSTTISNFMYEAALPAETNEEIGFVGTMDASNWATPEQSPSASANHSTSALTMSAGQGGGGTTKRITIPSDGEISFDYTAQFTGSGGLVFSYKINGVSTEISNGTGSGSKMGIVVKAGDVFEFYTWGLTQYSTYSTTISNFKYLYSQPYIGAVSGFGTSGGSVTVTYNVISGSQEASCSQTFTVVTNCTVTAIDNKQLINNEFIVYPNPVKDILNVNNYAEVYDLMGNKVLSGSFKLNMDGLSSGIYLIKQGDNVQMVVKE